MSTPIELGDTPLPLLEVIAVDDQGVLGSRVDSHLWGALTQCESLLRKNGIPYSTTIDEIAAAQILLVGVPYYENPYRDFLLVSYQPDGRPVSLRSGRPAQMAIDGATAPLPAGIDVVGAIREFLQRLDSAAAAAALALPVRIEEFVGSANVVYLLIEELIEERRSLRGEVAQLLRRQDELKAEIDLLRTQIAEPDERKVHWASSSAMISLVAIAALVQGADSLVSLGSHLQPLAERIAQAAAAAAERCQRLLE